jgi:hypothetical protein
MREISLIGVVGLIILLAIMMPVYAYGTANTTKETAPAKQPGFEGVYAITGLLAAGFLLMNRKR